MSDRPLEFLDSPLYPLPADYDELSTEGQRLARCNACRLWTLRTPHDTSEDLARRLIASTDFFDRYYLWPDDEDDFDPAFYDMPPLPTPAIHWALSRLWACERLSVAVAPRGSAKTTHGRKDIALRLITEPKYSFVYATSSIDNARITGEMIRFQCYENQRIQDDWRAHYGADSMKPGHGAGMKSSSHFKLINGSSLRVVSANSKLRGMRPRRFRLDDPEHDAKQSTDMEVLRRYIQELVFRVVLPAVTRPNVACDWTATYVSPKHFAPHAMQVVRDADGVERAADPRFDMWGRLFIPGAYRDDTGTLVSCWPEMWPIDDAERRTKGLAGSITHEEMKVMMGPTAYNIEILGELKHGEDAYFKIDPSPQGKHAFWFTDVDELLRDAPTQSSAKINFIRGVGSDATTISMPLKDFFAVSRTFMTVDSAYTETLHADRRVCTCMAITPENELFILDMWSDQKGDDMLVNKAFAMCERWRCPVIYVEVVKETIATYKRFQSLAHTKATEFMGHSHVPAIKDLKPGMMSKVGKISTLDVRVEYGLLKMPIMSRGANPAIGRLLDQLDGFSPEVQDGGLAKDDEIDTVAMSMMVIKGRHHGRLPEQSDASPKKLPPVDVIEEIKAGKRTYEVTGRPLTEGLDPRMLDGEAMAALMEAAAGQLRNTARKGSAV